jgi:hypothetical protein
MRNRLILKVCVLVLFMGLFADGEAIRAAVEMVGAVCTGNADCADTDQQGALVFPVADNTCDPPRRCYIEECTGGDTDFNYCTQSEDGGPCEKSGTIDVHCTGCMLFDCNCVLSNGNCDVTNCSTGGTGGQEKTNQTLVSSCVS